MIRAIHRLITSVSVRTRVVVLAAIPVIGFLINGIAFMVGQNEVERAFDAAARATNVSEASREFRASVNAMRARTRDFAASPNKDLIAQFETAHAAALRTLGVIDSAVSAQERQNIPRSKASSRKSPRNSTSW